MNQTSDHQPIQKTTRSTTTQVISVATIIGGVLGYLLRPAVPLAGQLPFDAVISRGGSLRGIDQMLVGYAQTSFNYVLAGLLLGGIVGFLICRFRYIHNPYE